MYIAQLDKGHWWTTHFHFSDERTKTFSLRLKTRQDAHSTFLLNILLEVLARVIRQENKTKGVYVGKEDVKL